MNVITGRAPRHFVIGGRTPFGGIFILGIAGDTVRWARVYTEPVEQSGAGIDASINAAYDRGQT